MNLKRKTKIVATVGPSCDTKEKLKALMGAGADVLRINASHTNEKTLRRWIELIRSASSEAHTRTAILVDLQGPRVRTGRLKDGKPVRLTAGDVIYISPGLKEGAGNQISTVCRQFTDMVGKGDRFLIDNGLLELHVLEKTKTAVKCRVTKGGILGENKGINIPNAPITLPALTDKDKKDLAVALAMDVDYIALSFVRSEQDVLQCKQWMKRRNKNIPMIAKIEKPLALERIDAIAKVADGIMVARGDLGIEKGVEKIPVIQKQLINLANNVCLPVITATQMLESMIHHFYPTRAEASDVANAVFDGTDAVMLSGETAVGEYPLECVRMMAKIIVEAEAHAQAPKPNEPLAEHYEHDDTIIHALTLAACHAANSLGAKAILVFTRSGKTALMASKFRPSAPILAFTDTDDVVRRLAVYRGVMPMKTGHSKNADQMLKSVDHLLMKQKFLRKGDPVIVLSGRHAFPGFRYIMKLHHIDEK